MSYVQVVSDADFEDRVLRSSLPVLVKFSAEWCGPCKKLTPLLEDLAAETRGRLIVVELDIGANPNAVREHRVMSLPALLLFRGGAVIKPVSARLGKQQLIAELDLQADAVAAAPADMADVPVRRIGPAAAPGS